METEKLQHEYFYPECVQTFCTVLRNLPVSATSQRKFSLTFPCEKRNECYSGTAEKTATIERSVRKVKWNDLLKQTC